MRHRARELAAQFLYSMDAYPAQALESALELFFGEGSPVEAEPPEVKAHCRELVRGAWDHRAEVDELLLRVMTGWRPDRMAAMDRAVVRLMTFEGFLTRQLPVNSAISEAVAIAKVYGAMDSARFVNGVMARVAQHLFPDEAKS